MGFGGLVVGTTREKLSRAMGDKNNGARPFLALIPTFEKCRIVERKNKWLATIRLRDGRAEEKKK